MYIPKKGKCHFCPECNGEGCISELPGMGGVRENINFILNCKDWNTLPQAENAFPAVRLAPITGAVENVGYEQEEPFYADILAAAVEAGIGLSIGDGCPDIKLQSGITALRKLNARAAVFIKPYENSRIFERMEWCGDRAEMIGIDIDSYNIVTMRNLVHLEKKNAAQLLELKKKSGVPFAIKGIFTEEDIELVKSVRPDIAVISNHGGRVETRTGSTADFLRRYGKVLGRCAGTVWVDGGIRNAAHMRSAAFFGASEVLVGRPFITALLRGGPSGIRTYVETYLGPGSGLQNVLP